MENEVSRVLLFDGAWCDVWAQIWFHLLLESGQVHSVDIATSSSSLTCAVPKDE